MNVLKTGFVIFTLFFLYSVSEASDGEIVREQKVEQLLSAMTLEEKVGQMTQVTLEVVSKPRAADALYNELDPGKLREAILKYRVGSILNCGGAANSLSNWREMITAMQDIAVKESRLHIPLIYGIDAIHGANYTTGATLFPQAIAMAATRNRELVRQGAAVTASEMKACAIPWDFNPVLDMGRQPLWPRLYETLGEDTYLAAQLGRAYIEGIQGRDISASEHGAACLKHYIGYSFPLSGQDRTPAWIPERMMREIFLPTFAEAVKAGAMTVMVNSAEVNGIPMHSNKYWLTDVLKGELGFQGFIVSDWEDIKRLHTRDKVAESPREAVKMAVMAGLDMSMVPYDYSFYDLLLELVQSREVPLSRIDDAVRRILRVKYQLGLFDNPVPGADQVPEFAAAGHTKINQDAAREVITLLKNEKSVLPLRKNIKVLVTGPTADKLTVLNGGWTITWQGNDEKLYPPEKQTLLEAIRAKIGEKQVLYEPGSSFEQLLNIKKTEALAAKADVIIVALGEDAYCETPGNISDLSLPAAQLELAKAMQKTGKPVVLVLFEGRPRVIRPVVDGSAAIVLGYLPGMEGAEAMADVLFGDYNPGGKLPFSYPRTVNGFVTYDYKPIEFFDSNKYDPEFPFGHGLSYTSFEYTDLRVDKITLSAGDELRVSVTVKNTGQMAGQEAVELYLTDTFGSVTRPVRQLKEFTKVSLEPGESRPVVFTLPPAAFSFIGRENKPVTEDGEFIIQIGPHQQTIHLISTATVNK